jgi:hypothetical protein
LFSFTAYSAFAGLVVGVGLFLIWSVWAFFPGALSLQRPNQELIALILLFDLVLLAVGSMSFLARVWSIRFFETEFTVRARHLKKAFPYSKVQGVHMYVVFSGVRRGQVMSMDILGEKPLTITGNPKSRVLNTDLYTWLQEVVRRQQHAEEDHQAVAQ